MIQLEVRNAASGSKRASGDAPSRTSRCAGGAEAVQDNKRQELQWPIVLLRRYSPGLEIAPRCWFLLVANKPKVFLPIAAPCKLAFASLVQLLLPNGCLPSFYVLLEGKY